MDQLYFDGMAISASIGFPDLFLTFTCNPNWSEIQRLLAKTNLKAHDDHPDIISKVFKIKFNELMNDLTKKHVLGKSQTNNTICQKVICCSLLSFFSFSDSLFLCTDLYTIEF
jgi:hypothetical protein